MHIADLEKRLRDQELESLHKFQAGTDDAPILYRPSGYALEKAGDGPRVFVASEETVDRMGDIIHVDGWDLRNFKKNPVYMLQHDYGTLPIGRVPKVWVDGKQLLNTVEFDPEDPIAVAVQGKFDRGFMKAQSVGFRPLEFAFIDHGVDFQKQELLEISAVSIPAHPHALAKALASARAYVIMPSIPVLRSAPALKMPMHSHHSETSDEPWDAAAMRRRLPNEEAALRKAHAWMDSEGGPDSKASYKFLHHFVSEDGAVMEASTKACSNGIGVLNGGRGGADIPEEDMKGVHAHMARHMRDADMEPPPLRSAAEIAERAAVYDALDARDVADITTLLSHTCPQPVPIPTGPDETETSIAVIGAALDSYLAKE